MPKAPKYVLLKYVCKHSLVFKGSLVDDPTLTWEHDVQVMDIFINQYANLIHCARLWGVGFEWGVWGVWGFSTIMHVPICGPIMGTSNPTYSLSRWIRHVIGRFSKQLQTTMIEDSNFKIGVEA